MGTFETLAVVFGVLLFVVIGDRFLSWVLAEQPPGLRIYPEPLEEYGPAPGFPDELTTLRHQLRECQLERDQEREERKILQKHLRYAYDTAAKLFHQKREADDAWTQLHNDACIYGENILVQANGLADKLRRMRDKLQAALIEVDQEREEAVAYAENILVQADEIISKQGLMLEIKGFRLELAQLRLKRFTAGVSGACASAGSNRGREDRDMKDG